MVMCERFAAKPKSPKITVTISLRAERPSDGTSYSSTVTPQYFRLGLFHDHPARTFGISALLRPLHLARNRPRSHVDPGDPHRPIAAHSPRHQRGKIAASLCA